MFSKFLFFIKNDIKHIKKTSLKKFKGQSEAANQRWTDSLMAKGKGTSNDLKNTTQKTKRRTTRTPPKQNGNWTRVFRKYIFVTWYILWINYLATKKTYKLKDLGNHDVIDVHFLYQKMYFSWVLVNITESLIGNRNIGSNHISSNGRFVIIFPIVYNWTTLK